MIKLFKTLPIIYWVTCSAVRILFVFKWNLLFPGDALTLSRPFTTKDFDQDDYDGNCAKLYHGAWWYARCHSSNLNGKYLSGETTEYATSMTWSPFRGQHYSLKSSKMMFRPSIEWAEWVLPATGKVSSPGERSRNCKQKLLLPNTCIKCKQSFDTSQCCDVQI